MNYRNLGVWVCLVIMSADTKAERLFGLESGGGCIVT